MHQKFSRYFQMAGGIIAGQIVTKWMSGQATPFLFLQMTDIASGKALGISHEAAEL
ncbi:hypothetical protein JMJ56_19520 [Belnapia sp. T18]|uniref:MFS transporter n=1 Tax=Belnapia arida TaxID=2804533 RepID=A0ABS1U6A8_9PROT|nr:hypothetical protein [Belnapia arida]MBL6080211.1 hypothetical protein [Belnapia arida]